jgi:hypothetical protein
MKKKEEKRNNSASFSSLVEQMKALWAQMVPKEGT